MRQAEKRDRETTRVYAKRIITEKIISLELEPGQMMSETEFAGELEMSRTPVREALIELSKTGIIEVMPQKGIRVSLIDYSKVEEARFLRLALETAILDRVCEITDKEAFSALVENVQLQQFYLDNQQVDKIMELDDAFHKELFRLAGMMQVYQLVSEMSIYFDRMRRMSLTSVKDLKIVADHTAILDAILHHDVNRAKEITTEHLSRYQIDRIAIRNSYPARYFVSDDS